MEGDIVQYAGEVGSRVAQQLQAVAEVVRPSELSRQVAGILDGAMHALQATAVWGPANRMPSNEFWKAAETWLRWGDLQVHARTKPRGYAGDYELLQKIGTGTRCAHPLGHAMDDYFQNQAAPGAVRQRMQVIRQRIVELGRSKPEQTRRVVSVGSGPALEIRQALEDLQRTAKLQVTLVDLDPEAIDFASAQLKPWLAAEDLRAVRANLARLPERADLIGDGEEVHYLYCLGFFDYLDEPAAREMLKCFLHSLASDGVLTVFNFAPANPSRAFMEWIGNWYLTYRDADAMRALAEQVAAPSQITTRVLAAGTLVELTICRGGDATL